MRRFSFLFALIMVFTSAFVASSGSTSFAAPSAPVSSVLPYAFVGQKVTLSGNIGTPVVRSVELQKLTTSWKAYATGTTLADGSYSFSASTTSASRQFRVFAKAEAGQAALTSDVMKIVTQKDTASLRMSRDPVLNAAGTATGTARGVASPKIPGRMFALQYLSGTTWVTVGSKVAEASDGSVVANFTLAGSKSYRLRGDAVIGETPAVSSPTVAFKPGPKTLGKNVIYVTTDSGKTPVTKGIDYTGTAVIVSGATATAALPLETIAVRGNSTALMPKKPYKLKFLNKDDGKPFGLKKDKTWNLLANYVDHSLVRNKVALELGAKESGLKWTPASVYTELFINGKYLGSYQLTQSIKIDSNRVNVSKTTGVITEITPLKSGVPGFKGASGLPFVFKDPDERKTLDAGGEDPEGLTNAKIAGQTAKIKKFEKVLYAKADWGKVNLTTLSPADDWTTYLDMDSAVDYYLTKEFTKDYDSDFYRSGFFHTNNYDPASADKIFMGPIWDFDRGAGAKLATAPNGANKPTGWWLRGNGSDFHYSNKIHWYTKIAKDPRFLAALKARWATQRLDYKAVGDTRVDAAVADMGAVVAANDRALWGNPVLPYPAKSSTFAGEITWVKNWYKARYTWMNDQLKP